jgi:hypothetical protein
VFINLLINRLQMRCQYCGIRINQKNLIKHHQNYCDKYPVGCGHCFQKIERNIYLKEHDDHCLDRPISCKFCKDKHTIYTLPNHLSHCIELDRLLLEKYNVKFNTQQSYRFVELFESIIRWPNKQYVFTDFISEGVCKDYLMKIYYCFCHCPKIMTKLHDPSSTYYMDYNDKTYTIWKYFPIALLPELQFIMGDEFTINFYGAFKQKKNLLDEIIIDVIPSQYFGNWKLYTIVFDHYGFQIASEKYEVDNYRSRTIELLMDKNLNVYVSKMIVGYFIL